MTNSIQEQKFKQTEIGEIPMDWDIAQIKNLTIDTETINPAQDPNKQIKYIDVTAVSNKSFSIVAPTVYKGSDAPGRARKLIRENDVIVATIRPTLKRIAFVPKEFDGEIASTAFCIVRANTEVVCGRYLYYRVLCSEFIDALGKTQRGASYPAVTDKEVLAQYIPIPRDIKEQEKIAFVLSEIQKTVETQEKIVAGLKELKTATMEKLFREGTRGEPLKQTEIGEIPQSWDMVSFESFATLQRGFDLPVNTRITGNVPVIGSNGIVGYHNEAGCSGPGVMTGRSGSIGLAFYSEGDYWPLNTSLFVVDFHDNHPRFVYYFFQQFNFKKYGSGVSVPTLNRNSVHTAMLAIPRKEEQIRISEILLHIDNSIDASSSKLEKIKQLFNSTLHQLMTGKKRVKDLNIEEIL